MTLHLFNPEHDIALASNLANFTAPHAGRQLRHDLGFLPALWAEKDDRVWVDDVEVARRGLQRLNVKLSSDSRVAEDLFVSSHRQFSDCERISPWGWDAALKATLKRKGFAEELLPTEQQLATIRHLSHRRIAADLLGQLTKVHTHTVGKAEECLSLEQVTDFVRRNGKTVLKTPWSSSGRGLRFPADEQSLMQHVGWVRNILQSQGSVMAEPYYNKVKDFGMEFCCTPEGVVRYEGLSLFHTANGAYTGNILATEHSKRSLMEHYLPLSFLDAVQHDICQRLSGVFCGKYAGPFGIDMMIVRSQTSYQLHPCVEINLRRTMGHVALSLSQLNNPAADDDICKVMRIVYEDHIYKLKIQQL